MNVNRSTGVQRCDSEMVQEYKLDQCIRGRECPHIISAAGGGSENPKNWLAVYMWTAFKVCGLWNEDMNFAE